MMMVIILVTSPTPVEHVCDDVIRADLPELGAAEVRAHATRVPEPRGAAHVRLDLRVCRPHQAIGRGQPASGPPKRAAKLRAVRHRKFQPAAVSVGAQTESKSRQGACHAHPSVVVGQAITAPPVLPGEKGATTGPRPKGVSQGSAGGAPGPHLRGPSARGSRP